MADKVNTKFLYLESLDEITTTDIPAAKDKFLFYDGVELKTSEMSNIYDRINSSYLGYATTSTTPPADGAWWYRVDTAETYTNFKDASGNPIIIYSSDFFDGTHYYDVTLEVVKGVATKKNKMVNTPTFKADNIAPNQTTFAREVTGFGKNRFDKTNVTGGKFVNAFTGKLDANANYVASDFIYVGDLTQITGTKIWHIAFYSEKTEASFISGVEYSDTVAVPSGAKYARVSVYLYEGYGVDTYQLEGGTSKTAYEPFTTGESGIIIENLILPESKKTTDLPKILLPSVYYLANGKSYDFFFCSFMMPKLGDKLNNYYCSAFSYRGQFMEKKFRVIATDDFDTTFKVEDASNADKKTVHFKTATVNSGNGVNRKVLVIGDSTINQEITIDHIANYFNADNMDITLLGTRQTAAGNKHEGRSGWTMQNFIENTSFLGVNNPFLQNGTFNFANYMSTTGQNIGANDWVFIQLGINDLYPVSLMDGSQTDTEIMNRINAVKARLELMINSIKAYNPGIRVGIIQTFPPAISQDATGNLLNSSFYSLEYYYKKGLAKWWEHLIQFYDTDAKRNEKIYLIGANAVIDRENDFIIENRPIDQYDNTQSVVQIDDVHPRNGYKQVADLYAGIIKYFA